MCIRYFCLINVSIGRIGRINTLLAKVYIESRIIESVCPLPFSQNSMNSLSYNLSSSAVSIHPYTKASSDPADHFKLAASFLNIPSPISNKLFCDCARDFGKQIVLTKPSFFIQVNNI